MNITYILDIIKLQFNEISNSDSPQCGETLLMISAFILNQIKNEPNVFTNSSNKQLRRAFLYCSKISRILTSFANQYSTPITQKAQQILNTIAENEVKIKNIQHDCEKCETGSESIFKQKCVLESANSALLSAQSTLEARKTDFDSLSNKIESLRKIQSNITDEKILILRTEIDELEPLIQKRRLKYEKLANHRDALSKKVKEFTTLITTVQNDDEILSEKILIKQLEFEKLKNMIATHKQNITDLTTAIQKANNEYTEMKALIETNYKIAKAIQNSGYTIDDKTSPDSFYRKVEDLNQQAKKLESEYDLLLKNVLNEANALLQKISQRQEPDYLGGE